MFSIMQPIYIKVIFDRKKRATNKHEGALEIRLSQSRRSLYYATGIRLLPKHWHDGMIVNRVDAADLQQTLDLVLKHVRSAINDAIEKGSCTLDDVMDVLRMHHQQMSWIDFCEKRTAIRSYGRSKDSQERYHRFLRFLADFGTFQSFTDITDQNILSMDSHLTAKGMKPYSKWNNYHRFLNSFIIDAIDAGYLTRNPYRWLHIDKEMSKGGLGKYLTYGEFMKLSSFDPPTDCLRRVRDLFIFQTYTCLSYVDLASFDAGSIYYVSGQPVYTANRGKTDKEFTFLVLPPAMKILRKYDNHLPILSNVKYNQYLKVLSLMSGIHKPISSHWARHTGATMLLNEGGLDMEVVAKILGHSSSKITRQVYAKLLDDTVVKEMQKMIKK